MVSPRDIGFDNLTVAILTHNSATTLKSCLDSIPAKVKILVLDDNSTDDTLNILKSASILPLIVSGQSNFADKRNQLLAACRTDWILYLDSDEQLTPTLIQEISKRTTLKPQGYQINRQNYFLGTKMFIDRVDRLFHRKIIDRWVGKVHESPICNTTSLLIDQGFLIHHSHVNITAMLEKTNHWSEYEARLRLDAKHPPIQWWRLIRIFITFFSREYFGKQLFRYGRSGLFESYFQAVDKVIVYTKLWELQQT